MSQVFDPRLLTGFDPTHLVVHYHEIALKGRNRSRFEDQLVRNLRTAIGRSGTVRKLYGRISVQLAAPGTWTEVTQAICGVFGIAYILPAVGTAQTLEALAQVALTSVTDPSPDLQTGPPPTFGIVCKRAAKELPFRSVDVARRLGDVIRTATNWTVRLNRPDIEVRVELVNRAAFVGFGKIQGPGGMPTGAAGKVACLLSAGIDSPVASYRLLRRGATACFIHFHSYPHTGIESQQKVRELAERVLPVGQSAPLYQVPFAELQRKIVTDAPEQLRVLLYRRFMLRAAETIARRENARALVTGESLGQVASQTLENLHSVAAATRLPILRPLIGMDKFEIVAAAQAIGTYETSIEPHGDCCSFLMPSNPATSSWPDQLTRAEAVFDVAEEVTRLVRGATRDMVKHAVDGVSRRIGVESQ